MFGYRPNWSGVRLRGETPDRSHDGVSVVDGDELVSALPKPRKQVLRGAVVDLYEYDVAVQFRETFECLLERVRRSEFPNVEHLVRSVEWSTRVAERVEPTGFPVHTLSDTANGPEPFPEQVREELL